MVMWCAPYAKAGRAKNFFLQLLLPLCVLQTVRTGTNKLAWERSSPALRKL